MRKSDFNKSLERLEEIVKILEGGDCPLEKSIELFEEGVELTKHCNKVLEKARQKIITLSEAESENNNDE
ncbi:MAG TPA: exodeoxyribonuclease VII small subunit [Clostridiales bacterium]|nr:exodeoxyribonuclease VII small subunit [Clostridiales bacterium]